MKTILLITLSVLLTIPVLAQQRIYVDASSSSSGNGQSWATAYNNLSVALNNAAEGAEIWVAEGVYVPDGPARACQFTIDKNLRLYGGFRGNEVILEDRGDYREHPTILSGDRLGDDIPGNFSINKNDNCRHVIFITQDIDNSTVIDGFFIQGGHTDGQPASDDPRRGGGILTYGGPIISNCNFNSNYGYFGGALFLISSNSSGTQIIQSHFVSNQAYRGGAIFTLNNTDISINDSYFFRNKSSDLGSVLLAQSSDWRMINCLMVENTSPESLTIIEAGSTIANVQTDSFNNESHLINNTFVDNIGFFSGVSNIFIRATESASLDFHFKNNIFSNSEGENTEDIGDAQFPQSMGESKIISQGGNLSINNPQQLNHFTDQINVTDPIFVNPETGDYSLIPGSPAIGAGVGGMDVPFDDIRGQFRSDPPSSGAYDAGQECIYMPASCICFDYTLIDNQLSASMPCGDNVSWYINDSLEGQEGAQFNFDLSSGFGSEVTFCVKQDENADDYRCCVTIYLGVVSGCVTSDLPNAHITFEKTDDSVHYFSGTSDNQCTLSWTGIRNVNEGCRFFTEHTSAILIDTTSKSKLKCLTVSNLLGYSRYCVDDFSLGADYPKVIPTFDWENFTLTIEMDDDFPSFPIGSAVFLDPGDGGDLIDLEDFIEEGSFQYEYEPRDNYLVKLYVNHPKLANYTISWMMVPITVSCGGGKISFNADSLLLEACHNQDLIIQNLEQANCPNCGTDSLNISYQWKKSTDEENWHKIIDAVDSILVIDSVLSELTYFRRKAMFSLNVDTKDTICIAYSNPVTVYPMNSGGIASPDQVLCPEVEPESITLVDYTGKIQWQRSSDNINWEYIADALSDTLSSDQMGNIVDTTFFRAKVSTRVCPPAYSDTVSISVAPESVAGTVSSNQEICEGTEAGTIRLVDYFGDIQWQSSLDKSQWDIIDGANSDTLTPARIGNLTDTTYFRALVSAFNCDTAFSNIVTISVFSVRPGSVEDQEICADALPEEIILTDYFGDIQWQSSIDKSQWDIIDGANSDTFTIEESDIPLDTTYFRARVSVENCEAVFSDTITVYSPGVAGEISSDQFICRGSTPESIVLNDYLGAIQWQRSEDKNNWMDIGHNSDTLSSANIDSLMNTTYFRAVVTNGACDPMYSDTVVIMVDSVIYQTISDTLCKGQWRQFLLNEEPNISWDSIELIQGSEESLVLRNDGILSDFALRSTELDSIIIHLVGEETTPTTICRISRTISFHIEDSNPTYAEEELPISLIQRGEEQMLQVFFPDIDELLGSYCFRWGRHPKGDPEDVDILQDSSRLPYHILFRESTINLAYDSTFHYFVEIGDVNCNFDCAGRYYLGGTREVLSGARIVVRPLNLNTQSIQMEIYPNPTSSGFTLRATNATDDYRVEILDLTGRKVWEQPFVAAAAIRVGHQVDAFLSSGLYIVRITGKKGDTYQEKLIITE